MQVFVSSERFLERVQEVLFNYIKGKTIRNWVSKDTITTPKVKGGLVFFKSQIFITPKSVPHYADMQRMSPTTFGATFWTNVSHLHRPLELIPYNGGI